MKPPGPDTLAASLLLGSTAIGIILRDPLLPGELMPARHLQGLIAATDKYQQAAKKLWGEWLMNVD